MNIDWNSLLLVAVTTVVAAIAIVGVFSLGVAALTSDSGSSDGAHSANGGVQPGANGGVRTQPSSGAKLAGYACIGISGLLVLYGLYLVIPQFH
jgi:hypothetical protein